MVGGGDDWDDLAEKIKGGIKDKIEGVGDKDLVNEPDKQQEEQVEVQEDEGEMGRRAVRKYADPKLPTDQEVKEHYAGGHMPFRS